MNEKDVLKKLKTQLDDAQKEAGNVEQNLAEARNILQAYSRKSTNVHYTNFGEMVLEASKGAEYLTERLRRLSLEVVLDTQKYENYKSDLVLIHGIDISYQNQILEVKMPVLVPHRKQYYTDFLYKPLHTAFQHWCLKQAEDNKEIPVFEKCTVCFIHQYDKQLPLTRVRDHDNCEEKHVLDVISNFFLVSDSGLYLDTYHSTRMGEMDGTRIYIMDSRLFPEWIAAFCTENSIEKKDRILE